MQKLKRITPVEENPIFESINVVETGDLTRSERRLIGTEQSRLIIAATSAGGHVYANVHAHGDAESTRDWLMMTEAVKDIERAISKGAGVTMSNWTYISKKP